MRIFSQNWLAQKDMGGFVVIPKDIDETANAVDKRSRRCLDVFSKKNLRLDVRFERNTFVAYRFDKIEKVREAFIEYGSGEFIFYTGTLIYRNRTGREALQHFFDDFAASCISEKLLAGNFCIVIYTKDHLSVLTDYCGYYPVYQHEATSSVSNSFLAIAKLDTEHHVSRQEIYEYIFHGFFVSKETFLRGIQLLDSRHIWHLEKSTSPTARTPEFEAPAQNASFEDLVKMVAAEQSDYYNSLTASFAERFGVALSGGYDTRHVLALLRKASAKPYLYVYGDNNDSDVVIAKQISSAENLGIHHTNKAEWKNKSIDEYIEAVKLDLYFFDGIKPAGVIDNGSDLETRFERAKHAHLHLNGAGGEIYREIWNISDRSVDLMKFIQMRFDIGSYEFCQEFFNCEEYFTNFVHKVQRILDIDRKSITRSEAEMLFPFLRNRFAQANNAANSQISDSLLPFMESRFVFPSFKIPIKYKYAGRFHAALICEADRALAQYTSSYGINFLEQIPLRYRFRRMLERQVPLSARRLARRYRSTKVHTIPYYFSRPYLNAICDLGALRISEYVNFSGIKNPDIMSRALSVELLLNDLRTTN